MRKLRKQKLMLELLNDQGALQAQAALPKGQAAHSKAYAAHEGQCCTAKGPSCTFKGLRCTPKPELHIKFNYIVSLRLNRLVLTCGPQAQRETKRAL